MNKQYIVVRYRSDDSIHKKGDIQYIPQRILYIGQTPECKLELPKHPDYADVCYAIIKQREDGACWYIIRQDKDAIIQVNGMSLGWIEKIKDNDRLTFDKTHIVFHIENGQAPVSQYVKYHQPKWIGFSLLFVSILLLGIIGYIYDSSKNIQTVYKEEIESIYQIEADTLFVLQNKDTLDIIPIERSFVGTGFIVDEGYFVTARHCIEFWLGMENELKPNFYDIESEIVKRAIEAEVDSTIRLVSLLKITSHDGKRIYRCTSENFLMDKSRDNIYECGNFEMGYLWRSIVSMFEKRDAELGDVAVKRWNKGKGTITLESPETLHQVETELCSFGYPQSESSQKAFFSLDEGKIYQSKETPDECFICTKGFDPGFSGGPVFNKREKKVIGIVSRASDSHTLIVPVSQIHRLINQLENNESTK